MALVLKRIYQGYFYLFEELADKRSDNLYLMTSPIPTAVILFLWYKFVSKWGVEYMKDKKPMELKTVMIFYNILQVLLNSYVVYYIWLARNVISWRCTEIDYSNSYWGLKFLELSHFYYLLKILDLLDTIFFVLRKKGRHLSFLHVYHHFVMVAVSWVGVKFVAGGHTYFLGAANCPVHIVLYAYYLLTAYDSKYSKLLWLKKFITQLQLTQFGFLLYQFGKLLFMSDCQFPKFMVYFLIPQNLFMIVLFGDFYVRSYILEPRKKRKELEKKMQTSQKN